MTWRALYQDYKHMPQNAIYTVTMTMLGWLLHTLHPVCHSILICRSKYDNPGMVPGPHTLYPASDRVSWYAVVTQTIPRWYWDQHTLYRHTLAHGVKCVQVPSWDCRSYHGLLQCSGRDQYLANEVHYPTAHKKTGVQEETCELGSGR